MTQEIEQTKNLIRDIYRQITIQRQTIFDLEATNQQITHAHEEWRRLLRELQEIKEK
jgi:hypothetical protein